MDPSAELIRLIDQRIALANPDGAVGVARGIVTLVNAEQRTMSAKLDGSDEPTANIVIPGDFYPIAGDDVLVARRPDGFLFLLQQLRRDTRLTSFPVGSIYLSISDDDPATTLGYGVWEAFGAGRMLAGLDATDAAFDEAGETGGSKTNSHEHGYNTVISHNHSAYQDDHQHIMRTQSAAGAQVRPQKTTAGAGEQNASIYSGSATASGVYVNATGSASGATYGNSDTNNLPPYITVYMWKRTA